MSNSYNYINQIISVVFFLLFNSICVQAQNQENEITVPESLRRQVHTIESFIKRFNYEEDAVGNAINISESTAVTEEFVQERNKQILSLFDSQALTRIRGKNKQQIEEFLKTVNTATKQAKLNFYDKQWYAEVQMDVFYKQKPKQLTLVLQNEETQPRVSRWVIRSVKADFLNIKSSQADSTHIIPPNSHGTDFIGVPANLSDSKAIGYFVSKEVDIDVMSIFLYATYNQDLTFKQTRKVTYYFLQLEDWIMTVQDTPKTISNAGWLIIDIAKASNENKQQFAKHKLNIR